jgi:Tfp pilus assembly protein PilX
MKAHRKFRRGAHGRRGGAGLVIALVTLLIITSTMAAIIQSLLVDLRQTRQAANELQAQWLADSAVGRAAAQLRANPSYEGETWKPPVSAAGDDESVGVAEIRIERAKEPAKELRVIVDARYPDHPWRRVATRRAFLISPTNNNSGAGPSPQETAP